MTLFETVQSPDVCRRERVMDTIETSQTGLNDASLGKSRKPLLLRHEPLGKPSPCFCQTLARQHVT